MSLKISVAALTLLTASPALAATCSQPYAPQISIAANAAQADMLQARDDVESFIQASDMYQTCLVDSAKKDPTFRGKAEELLNANQQQKQHVAEAFNAAVKAFNATRATTSVARN